MIFDCSRDKYSYIKIVGRLIHERLKIYSNTHFCIDTGSPFSLISYEQAVILQIPFGELRPAGKRSLGGFVGGAFALDGTIIQLRSNKGKLMEFAHNPLIVLGPDFQDPKGQRKVPVPGLLGYDFLRQFTLVVESEQQGGRIVLLKDQRAEYY